MVALMMVAGLAAIIPTEQNDAALSPTDSKLYGIGMNNKGQLGDGTTTDALTPIQIGSGLGKIIDFSTANSATLFITDDGKLYGTGNNAYYQLGDGTTTDSLTPKEIGAGLGVKTKVESALYDTFFITDDGKLYGMGRNLKGEVGNNTTTNVTAPTRIGATLGTIVDVHSDGSTTYFITSYGNLYGTGANTKGQLGNNTTTDSKTPIQIGSGLGQITKVIPTTGTTYFITSDGKLYGMGANTNGQLGNNTTTDSKTPIQIGSGLGNITDFDAAGHTLFFITDDGKLYGTGANTNGQLGDGTTTDALTPIQIGSGLGTIIKIKCQARTYSNNNINYSYGCLFFITDDGKLYGTGANTNGQLGNGTTTDALTPIQIGSGLGDIVDVKQGATIAVSPSVHEVGTTYFITSDGKLYGTGANTNGQLGNGTTTDALTPIQIGSELESVDRVIPSGNYVLFTTATYSVTASIESSNDSYGTVSTASVPDIVPGTVATISDNTITIGETTITATPAAATDEYTYSFTNWTVDDSPVTSTYTIDVDTTFTANFARSVNTYAVTINAGSGGSVSPTTVASVPYGTEVTISGDTLSFATSPDATTVTATASDPDAQYTYSFSKWQLNGEDATGTVTTGTEDVFTAVFGSVINTYTVTIESNNAEYGTVDVSEIQDVPYGSTVTVSGNAITIGETTVTATAAETYQLNSWSVEDGYVIVGDTTITANFGQPVDPNQTLLDLIPLFAVLMILMSVATVGLRLYQGDYSLNMVAYFVGITVAVIVVCTLLIPAVGGS